MLTVHRAERADRVVDTLADIGTIDPAFAARSTCGSSPVQRVGGDEPGQPGPRLVGVARNATTSPVSALIAAPVMTPLSLMSLANTRCPS